MDPPTQPSPTGGEEEKLVTASRLAADLTVLPLTPLHKRGKGKRHRPHVGNKNAPLAVDSSTPSTPTLHHASRSLAGPLTDAFEVPAYMPFNWT